MFGRRKPRDLEEPPSQGAALRAMVLGLAPEEIGRPSRPDRQVWGVVMDTALDGGGWHSLVVLADGTASLYTSSAFGIIGAGAHEPVRVAGARLLELAEEKLALFGPDDDDALPAEGGVVIRALTFDGRRSVVAPESELGHGRHEAAPVFHAAHDVLTQMRLAATPG